jgi:hypothetical protein
VTDAIVNVQVMDMNAKSYHLHDSHKVLVAQQERKKMKKYLSTCLE